MAEIEESGSEPENVEQDDVVESESYDQKANDPWVQVLFPGSSFITTVLNALRAKEGMSSMMTHVYLLRAGMAGFFVSLFFTTYFAVFAAFSATGDAGAVVGRLLAPLAFGWALVFIYYTNSELLTANMMVVAVGIFNRHTNNDFKMSRLLRLMGYCLLGNLVGALVFAILMRVSTVLDPGILAQMSAAVTRKVGYVSSLPGTVDLFVRAILCNFCINIAMVLVFNNKLKNDFSKCVILVVAVFVFAFLGFEHSIANSALFLIMGLRGAVDPLPAILSVIVTILGNLVGGGLLVGFNFALMNRNYCRVRY